MIHFIVFLVIILAAKLSGSSIVMSLLSVLLSVGVFFLFDNLFWATFVFIYASNPGGLFSQYTFGLNIGSIVIDLSQLLFLSLLIKVWSIKSSFKKFYKPFLVILLLVVIINLFNGISGGFSEIRIVFRVFKLLLPLSFIYIFSRVIQKEDDFRFFFSIVFPFVFIAFTAQLLVYPLGIPPSVAIFGWEYEGAENVLGEVSAEVDLSRYAFSVFLQAISLMGTMYYLNLKNKSFNKYYLGLIMSICFFSVLLSGTRGWTIGFGSAILLWTLISFTKVKRFVLPGLGIALFVIILISIPIVNTQLSLAIKRIKTVELFVEGDVTAGETSQRFDVRGPAVMKAFRETNPVIGAGYSEYFFKNSDGHVGHQTLLLQSGYLGYILLNVFILFLILKQIYQFYHSKTSIYKDALAASSLILLGLYIIFPGLAIFSYMAGPEIATFYGVYLTFAGFFSYKAKLEDYSIMLKSRSVRALKL